MAGNGRRNPDLTRKTQLLDKLIITSKAGRKSPPKTSSAFPILLKAPSSYNAREAQQLLRAKECGGSPTH